MNIVDFQAFLYVGYCIYQHKKAPLQRHFCDAILRCGLLKTVIKFLCNDVLHLALLQVGYIQKLCN